MRQQTIIMHTTMAETHYSDMMHT